MHHGYFVLDDQTHMWDFRGGDYRAGLFRRTVEGVLGLVRGEPERSVYMDPELYMQEVFVETDTDMACLNALGFEDLFGRKLFSPEQAAAVRDLCPERLILFGQVNPLDGSKALEEMEYQVEVLGARSFKFYTTDPRDSVRGWFLDDEKVAYPIWERCIQLGIKAVPIHMGLPQGPHWAEYLHPRHVDRPCVDFPQLNFVMYHMAVPWWEEAAYLGYKLPNLYADVGGVVSRGTVRPHWLAHVLGEWMFALRPFADGGPKLTWGTDGPPAVDIQPMIEYFAQFQPPEELATTWGFPPITQPDKERIFSGYWLEWLGIDRKTKAQELAGDE